MTEAMFIDERNQFKTLFNLASFEFAQSLHESPLFEVDSLTKLAMRLPSTYHSTSQPAVGGGWEPDDDARGSLSEVISNMARTNSLVMLKRVEQDEEYGPFFQRALSEIVDLVGPKLRDDVVIGRATILVSSPHRVTAYHIDHDTNYLVQARGNKQISVFDGTDRSLLTDADLEAYYAGNLNSARYLESRQKDAAVYHLRPGIGIHVPSHSPHWVQNHNSVSVSVSFNFDLRSVLRLGRVYKFNHFLRKAGVTPAPPGRSGGQDGVKLALDSGLSYARGVGRTGKHLLAQVRRH